MIYELLNTDVWKIGGPVGFLLFSFISAIGVIWKYFTSESDKMNAFFLQEKMKYEEALKEDTLRIKELQDTILQIKEDNILKLEEANLKLREMNRFLQEQIRDIC